MKRLPAYPLYLLLNGVSAFARTMLFTVAAVYYVTAVGLNPFQLVLVGTTLMVVILLAEVPTGVLADVYSRRLSIIVGTCLIGLGFVIEGSIPHFWAILLSQLIWGLGATFTSGASEAWIADELGEERVGPAYVRGAQAGQLGALLGIVASVSLASIQLNWPMIGAGVILLCLGLVLILVMPEHGFTPAPCAARTPWQMAAHTVRSGAQLVRQRPVLMTIMAITFFLGMSSETFDRLWEVHFLEHFRFPSLGSLEPVVWFGIINGVALVLSMAAAEWARRRLDTSSHAGVARALLAINALLLVSVAAFGVAGNFAIALAAYWSAYLLRRTNAPLFTAWINQSLDSRVRATVISMAGQVDAVGQIAGGPLFGLLATVATTRVAMVAAALVIAPALALYLRTLRVDAVLPPTLDTEESAWTS